MSAEEVAKAFVQHYYQAFDTNVDGLAGLYVSFFSQLYDNPDRRFCPCCGLPSRPKLCQTQLPT
jgi:hypothetical protein